MSMIERALGLLEIARRIGGSGETSTASPVDTEFEELLAEIFGAAKLSL